MGDKRNYAALDWVIGEIGETLKDARQALESFVEDPRDTTRIRFCLTHIHQVHGSLQMVEFHGATLFAEEMEVLAEALMKGEISNEKEAQEALMRALLQLPIYLQQVRTYHDDHPGVVLPLLNDLRAVRKQSYLSETNLFNPDLSSLGTIQGRRHDVLKDTVKLKQVFKKLREMYQYAAAGVLRGVKIDENLAYLEKVVSRLEGVTRGTACYPIWQTSAALIEALVRDEVELSVAVRGLLRQLARELQILEVHCPAVLDAPARENLLRNLLYYVARAEDGSARVAAVKQQYGLDKALLGGGSRRSSNRQGLISLPEPDAIRAVVLALQDELNTAKHLLDLALSGQGGISDVEEMLPIVKRIGDTLAVLGIGEMRKQTMAQYDHLVTMCRAGDLSDSGMIDVATSLADIENRLEAIAKGADKTRDYANVNEREVEIDGAKEAVLAECRAGLETVKDAIVESMSAKWDPSHLPPAVVTLHNVQGGLAIVPLRRSAVLLEACGRFIDEQLVRRDSTPTDELQILAEAIASVDYYLERLLGGPGDDLDLYLDLAQESLERLGYAVPLETAGEPARPDEASVEAAAGEAIATESSETEGLALEPQLPSEAHDDGRDVGSNPATDDAELDGREEAAAPMVASVDDESEEESDIDEEIIEIFIEEAGEVQETLAEYLPKWRDNMADEDALTVIRRAFHTLKGSGRMVEAMAVGELAWSIENLLNRILDQSVTAQPSHGEFIARATLFVPELIGAYKDQQPTPNPEQYERYLSWAHQMAEGSVPEEFAGSSAQSDGASQDRVSQDTDSQGMEESGRAPFDSAGVEVEEKAGWEREAIELTDLESADDNEDQVLWDIFASEANTHLTAIDEFIEQMEAAAPIYSPPTDDLQRALHTLKGSAHMAAVTPIAAMVTPLESFVKELRSYQVKVDTDVLQLMRDAASYTREGLACIADRVPVQLPKLEQFVARVDELSDIHVAPLVHMKEQPVEPGHQVDPRLLSIFMAEEMSLLLDADEILARWQAAPDTTDQEVPPLVAELETLSEGALQANLPLMNELADQLTAIYNGILAGTLAQDERLFDVLQPAHECLLDMVDAVAAGQNVLEVPESLQAELAGLLTTALAEEIVDGQAETVPEASTFSEDIVLADAWVEPNDHAFDVAGDDGFSADDFGVDEAFSEGSLAEDEHPNGAADAEGDTREQSAEATDEFATAELVTDEESTTAHQDWALEQPVVESSDADTFTAQDWNSGEEALEVASGQPLVEGEDYDRASADSDLAAMADQSGAVQDVEPDGVAAPNGIALDSDDIAHINAEDYDSDILEIFLEEAGELVEEMDDAIHQWESDQDSVASPEVMKRALHTLKGGARLSGLKNVGDLTHEYETYLIVTDKPSADPAFFHRVHQFQDLLLNGTRAVRAMLDGAPAPEMPAPMAAPVAPSTHEVTSAQNEPDYQEQPSSEAMPVTGSVAVLAEQDEQEGFFALQPQSKAIPSAHQPAKRQGPQEMIKVSADLLEELVNLAGETSISRGRLQQQVSDLGSAVDEVDGTLRRMNEQLRRLDRETEAQVLFRQEQMAAHEGFDPLEMDRYSQLQQLTRSLMESASDLMDLKSTLGDKIKGTETLLLQQSRVNSALQEGLMRSRMVPFLRLVPRLRRIVRQVSGELGKHVNFELDNVEGEMDRSVLERMVAPLEHMLRNAVDHGIETPADRVNNGKPETGRILLSLAREGGDILLRLADDGRGINLERVRAKAIERGLMAADAELTDHDVMQFILQAGFSTAESVTQISGRGVGMDVVAAEIKQLGGSIVIDSKSGSGTQFTVRLPFTVSVNRALMVQLGLEIYAIPLNNIEGIVRVSPFELEHYFSHPDARFEYAGENYQVRYLGSMLSGDLEPKLDGQVLPLPVILVRSGQHTMALQVDGLQGSREIVVKSLGPQFAAVQGLSGATVMGDGSVVVILDPHALVRREVALQAIPAPAKGIAQQRNEVKAEAHKTIMVVDDSVTVRKVTTRFLEREGFNVVTAKDGMDALQVLQEDIPDLMLLDIEMPRMDGFELAKTMRSTQRLKSVPIIMITSRTGDKHRQHALSIGVNDYMGKPYQEETLLSTMDSLLGIQRERS